MNAYRIQIQRDTDDPEWDRFVATTPGGHHVQTSLWAQVKRVLGWKAARLVLYEDHQIVGGTQILFRQIAPLCYVGYITKGPLIRADAPADTAQRIIRETQRFCWRQRLLYLTVQPPNNGEALAACLPDWGFHVGSISVAPTASVVLDLTEGMERVMAEMNGKTRQNIRRGCRKGITVREGTLDDAKLFYQLYSATSRRQDFPPYPAAYFDALWKTLGAHGYLRLFIAEYSGSAVSGLLVVPFGDTVIAKTLGWSGEHGDRLPNEVLFWSAIKWAAECHYRTFDLEGVDPDAARDLLNGGHLSAEMKQTPTFFKIGFGGQVVLYPTPHDYIFLPPLRWAYYTLANRPFVERWVDRWRGRGVSLAETG